MRSSQASSRSRSASGVASTRRRSRASAELGEGVELAADVVGARRGTRGRERRAGGARRRRRRARTPAVRCGRRAGPSLRRPRAAAVAARPSLHLRSTARRGLRRARRRRETAVGRRVHGDLVDHEVAPARVHAGDCVLADAMRTKWSVSRSTSSPGGRGIPPSACLRAAGGEHALRTGPRARRRARASSARCAGPSACRRRRHRRRRLADLVLDRLRERRPASGRRARAGRRRRGGGCAPASSAGARRSAPTARIPRAIASSRRQAPPRFAWPYRISAFSSTSRALGIDLHLAPARGQRSTPCSRCTRRSAALATAPADVQISQCRSSSSAAQHAVEPRPALRRRRAVLGRAEGVVGDEDLRAAAG